MRALVLAAVVTMLAGCDGAPAPPPPKAKPPPELPPLPELKPSADFAKDEFLELAPGEAVSFGWDLREGISSQYSYRQEARATITITAEGKKGEVALRTQWKGEGQIMGGGNGRGVLSFAATPIAQWNNDQPLTSEELQKVQPIVVTYDLREGGSFSGPRLRKGQENPKLDLYFAIPSKDLKPGEKDKRDVHMAPIADDMGYHGTQEIVHAGRRKVGRHECVKLLSKVDLEAVPTGDGHGRLFGWIAAYYDPRERKAVRIDTCLAVAFEVRREMRPADLQVESYWVVTHVEAENRATFTLED